jgi:RNA polymerase sigma factor (sigma-70 family)
VSKGWLHNVLTENRRLELFQNFQNLIDKTANRFPTLDRRDLQQSGYVKLLELIDLKGEKITGGLVLTATKNLFTDILRAEIKQPNTLHGGSDRSFDPDKVLEISETLSAATAVEDDPYESLTALIDIEKTFRKYLSSVEQNVMTLRWVDGYTTPDVAEQMRINVKTVQRIEADSLAALAAMTEQPLPDLHKQLWRVLLLTAIASGQPVGQVRRFSKMLRADFDTVSKISKAQARKVCTAQRKAGY